MASNFLGSMTVAPGGIQDTQDGLDYQWRSLTYFASRCFTLQPIVKDFAVLTEIQEAEKFDDVVLKYTNQRSEQKWILAQVKHKKTAGALDSNSLITDKKYSLHKYFKSLWEISQRPGSQDIENVMMLTNNTLDGSANLNLGQILSMQVNQSSDNLHFEKVDHFMFDNIGEIYRFVGSAEPAKRAEVFKIVRNIILSFELTNVLDDSKKTDFLSLNQKCLLETIIDDSSLEFSDDFLNGTLIGFEFFNQIFEEALKEIGGKRLNSRRKIKQIQNKFQNIFDRSIDRNQLIANQNESDRAINEFLNKLLYVTNLKIEILQNEIKWQLRETFRLGNIKDISLSVESNIRKLFMSGRKKELTKEEFGKFLSECASVEVKKWRDESFRDMVYFKSIQRETEEFLHNTEEEVHFAAMRVLFKSSEPVIYIKSSFRDEDFEQGIIFFEKLNCYKLLIIELYEGTLQTFKNYETALSNLLQNNLSKKLVFIGHASLNVNFQNMQTLSENESCFTDLITGSQDRILDENIQFQDKETTWRAALDGLDLNNLRIPLKEILKNQLGKKIKVSKAYSEQIYIPRTILYNNCLKSTILQRNDQLSNDVFHFDKEEFEKQRQNQTPHHLLQRSGSQLEWIGSTRDLSIILEHIDESNPKCSTEEELLKSPHRITIISDVAGMGKSLLLHKLSEVLKENQTDHWVFKLDLNDHSEALDEMTKIQSPAEAIKFLGEKIMKFKSDFEKKHFTNSCIGTRKVILLIDGVDEIFSSYGEEVLNLIKLLSHTKIKKLFISTRPECFQRLEKEFLQIKHSLQPFSESDQKKYFLDFLKNKIQLKDLTEAELGEIVGAFMESMKRSIRTKDYKHTGVPLVTKLVAEYLVDNISNSAFDKTLKNLKLEQFSLWSLYEVFIAKSFHIYFKEKRGMDPKNAINKRKCEEEKRQILVNYKIYAIQEFLKKDAAKFFPSLANKKFTDFKIEEMVKVGLIYKTDDGYKFVHQTFAENLFTLHLMENFEQPKVAEFIVHFVFVEEKFQVIRSFVDFWIEEKISPGNCETYSEALLAESPAEHTTPIHVSAEEQNSKILKFVYNCLTKNSKFDSDKSKVEIYLFKSKKRGWKIPAIFDLIAWSENLNQILDSVRKDFGQKFVLEIFHHKFKVDNGDFNLQFYNSHYGENLPNILDWLRLNFPNDLEFLEKQIFSVFKTEKYGILHFAFWSLSNQTLSNLLEELENWGNVLGNDLIRNLVLKEASNRFFLFFYTQNEYFDTDFSIEFLKKLKVHFESEESFLTDFIFHGNKFNQTFLHRFCVLSKNFDLLKLLEWFRVDFGLEDLKKLLLQRDVEQESIIFLYFSNERNPILDGFDVLNFLKVDCKFDESFLKHEVILQKNNLNENILQQIFLRFADLAQFSNFVEEFKITDSELKSSFVGSETFLFYFAQKSEENQEKFVSFLERKFDGNLMNELFYDGTFYRICWNCNRFDDFAASVLKFFDFVERKFGLDFLKNLICFKGPENQTFLFLLFDEVNKSLMKILNYLFEKFENQKDFLAEVLLSVDDFGNTFLIHFFSQDRVPQTIKISKELFNSIKSTFGLEFLKKLLLIKNEQNRNFHLVLLDNKRYDGVEKSLEVFEILLEVVGKDKKFFVELTKQEEIPDQIKEFLKENFKIKRTRRRKDIAV